MALRANIQFNTTLIAIVTITFYFNSAFRAVD